MSDLAPADWAVAALKSWPAGRFRVRDLVPPVFEAYAAVAHTDQREGSLSRSDAAALVSVLRSHTTEPCWFGLWVGFGFLHAGGSSILSRGGTRFERWRGRRHAEAEARRQRREMRRLATFDLLGRSGRSYLLFRGTLDDVSGFEFGWFFQSPTLWWPDDHRWLVHTEIDATRTLLGGRTMLIEEVLAAQALHSVRVEPDDVAM